MTRYLLDNHRHTAPRGRCLPLALTNNEWLSIRVQSICRRARSRPANNRRSCICSSVLPSGKKVLCAPRSSDKQTQGRRSFSSLRLLRLMCSSVTLLVCARTKRRFRAISPFNSKTHILGARLSSTSFSLSAVRSAKSSSVLIRCCRNDCSNGVVTKDSI